MGQGDHVADVYLLAPEAIADHAVAAGGGRPGERIEFRNVGIERGGAARDHDAVEQHRLGRKIRVHGPVIVEMIP
jgi:hypothetical protein